MDDDDDDDVADWSPLPGYYRYAAPTEPQVTNSGSSSSEDDDDEESDEKPSYSADDSDLTSDTDEADSDYSWFAITHWQTSEDDDDTEHDNGSEAGGDVEETVKETSGMALYTTPCPFRRSTRHRHRRRCAIA